MTATRTIGGVMEAASGALVDRDYVACERLCLEAVGLAEAAGDWAMVAAIVLPLQEARRQRRIIATEGALRFGGVDEAVWPGVVTASMSGWWVGVGDAAGSGSVGSHRAMRAAGVLAETLVLLGEAEAWRVVGWSADGAAVSAGVSAPDERWLGGAIEPGAAAHAEAAAWLIEASERLGDAAIAAVSAPTGSVERVRAMEAMVAVFDDHEKLHQAWADAARAADAAGGGA